MIGEEQGFRVVERKGTTDCNLLYDRSQKKSMSLISNEHTVATLGLRISALPELGIQDPPSFERNLNPCY